MSKSIESTKALKSNKSLKSSAAYHKGIQSERIAADYFTQQNYEIIANRYKSPCGEIDLIIVENPSFQNIVLQNSPPQSPLSKKQLQQDLQSSNNPCIIFVEVKARATIDDCLYSISKRQQRRIIAAGECFLADNFAIYQHHDVRFDVIAINSAGELAHIKNAYENSYGD